VKVLVACEFSGIVRDAFAERGHIAVSCDLLPTESEKRGYHYRGDVRKILDHGWDLMIAHPPCTYLAVSGARWWGVPFPEQDAALEFVRTLMDAPIDKICVENPKSKISTAIRQPEQIIQPYMFGHAEKKLTCLWLKNLPPLEPTEVVEVRKEKIRYMAQSRARAKKRSKFYAGIAKAMSEQWG